MNFVTWSIRNPIAVIVLFVALTAAGLLSFPKLGIQDQPDIELPAVIVTVPYPGVPPSQLESEVTRKIEDAVSAVTGIEHISSTVNEGTSTTIVSFQFERSLSEAVDDIRDAVTRIRSDLPPDAREPIVSRVTTAGRPVVTFSVEASNMTDTELSWFVDLTVMRELTSVKGVGSVRRVGGVSREIRVSLDPDRMAALGATARDVSRQLRVIQAEYPGGEGRVGGLEQSVRTTGTLASAQELAALPIALADGRTVRLDTIADVRDQAAERRQLAMLDGKTVIGFEVVRAWGASAIDVADGTREAVAHLSKTHPNVQFREVSSTVDFIRKSYTSSMEMLFEGALLAVIVVWIFLRDWRATVISAAALPLAIIPTFWAMHLLGYSLNILTLLALSLVVGMLVDDAIVEVENIVRHLRMGKQPLQAAKDAAIEIGLAVVATTLTLCAVFVPVAFMGGIPGEFFRPFAFTAAVAVLFSLVVARMLTPMMAAYMLKPHDESNEDGRMKQLYLRGVAWCLGHRRRTLAYSTIFLIACFALIPFIPKGFAPAGDVGFAVLAVELAPGATLEETTRVAETIRERVMKMKEATSVYSIIGAAAGGGGPGGGDSVGDVRRASLTVQLVPADERDITQQEFQRKAAAQLRDIPGVRISFGAQTGSKLQITLAGDDPLQLERAASAVERDLRTLPHIGNVTSSASLMKPEIVIRPLPDRAAELGVTTETLSAVTRIATSGDVENSLAKLNLASRQVPIRVQLREDARSDLERIRLLSVPGRNGPVPLMSVADVSLGAGPARITRYDRSRNVTIEADLNGQPLGDMLAKSRQLPALKNLPAGVRQATAGEAEFMIELFMGFGQAMVVGILCIYLLLVLLFREFLQPITILSALPPSAGGALLCLWLTGYQMSIPSLIGMLMLMGIVTKNSILLVEYAVMAMHEHGLSRFDALIDACSKRARPIIMTTIAMGAGMLPIATGWSGDPSFRAPMGVAVIGGLVTSTALSLFVVPVIFTIVDDLQQRLRRAFGKRKSTSDGVAPVENPAP
ncbi:multidrug efflux pump subunit AcrB [Povalibacter uvarum]|uniref:Multidrug efflux pump subunit AcrB n=1 Tax=Povalibacter uvarum TaxID=732238 RepID=A0A841HNV6_9GAMM|nr:efflux RND transporter permease subunit [Povalibacter uvarum]MBB6094453.1 multidrug efflux pump subunit AcrB [Povalibacter uvarum]